MFVQLFNVQQLLYVMRYAVKKVSNHLQIAASRPHNVHLILTAVRSTRQYGVSGLVSVLVLCGWSTYGRDPGKRGDQTGGDNTRPHTARAVTDMCAFYLELL